MIYIGEKLNSSISWVRPLMEEKREEELISLIKAQCAGGAAFLDINTALCPEEAATLKWLISLVLAGSEAGIMLDSQNPEVIASALPCCRERPVIINSVMTQERFEPVWRIAAEYDCGLVCMPGIYKSAEETAAAAEELLIRARKFGIRENRIYLDGSAAALGGDDKAGVKLLQVIRTLRERHPEPHIICGLSNISFGMPGRSCLNGAALAMAAAAGLDSVILDTTDSALMQTAAAAELLLGKDEYGLSYIAQLRQTE